MNLFGKKGKKHRGKGFLKSPYLDSVKRGMIKNSGRRRKSKSKRG